MAGRVGCRRPDQRSQTGFTMKRGTIVWVNLGLASPPEFGKTRPCLVVSNSGQNLMLGSVVVVPMSTQSPEIWPLRLEFKPSGEKSSYAVLPGIRQVTRARLLDVIGVASDAFMQRVDEALDAYLKD